MAAISSLGIHHPAALSHFVAEGLLPQHPKRDQYSWETYLFSDDGQDIEEEIFTTKTAVAWSQGQLIRNVYRFDLEGEEVIQAILTTFPTTADSDVLLRSFENERKTQDRTSRFSSSLALPSSASSLSGVPSQSNVRALVVILQTKAHIHFLQGSRHIVDLPFQVEKAFAAPRGLILQRKRNRSPSPKPSPRALTVPPNSFFSSQQLASSASFLQSSALPKSFTTSHSAQPGPVGGNAKLEALFQDVITSPSGKGDDDVANLYTLSDPLSDLGVITYSIQHQRHRISGKEQPRPNVEFEGLDPAEVIVYCSTQDELLHSPQKHWGPLYVLVTSNAETDTVTVWHSWYLEEQSLRSLLKQRASHKAAKLRRRSSFLSANIGTGTTTPGVRHREGNRESFAAMPRAPGDINAPTATAVSSRKPTRQEEEEAMASQMDPDYQPTRSQQPVRESRRISSMNSDVRANQNPVGASFAGHGSRRYTSFGGANDRRSLGHRKSRGSTPGSVFSRSLGQDDESMDLDSTMDSDSEETNEGVVRHIRATFEAMGLDSVLGNSEQDFRKELVVRKVCSFLVNPSLGSSDSATGLTTSIKVSTLYDTNAAGLDRLNIYCHDRSSKVARHVQLLVKHYPLWPELGQSATVPIPSFLAERNILHCADILKLSDGRVNALLLGGAGVMFHADDQPCPLPMNPHYRIYNPFDFFHGMNQGDEETGKNRTLGTIGTESLLSNAGARGAFDEFTTDETYHRRRLHLRPVTRQIDTLFPVCEALLPSEERMMFRPTWCRAVDWLRQHPDALHNTSSDVELVALVTALFTFVVDLLSTKARAALNMSRLASGKGRSATSSALKLQKERHEVQLFVTSPWSWTQSLSTNAIRRSPRATNTRQDQLLVTAASLADGLRSATTSSGAVREEQLKHINTAVRLMFGLHVIREEQRLCKLMSPASLNDELSAVIAQLGLWLGLNEWSPSAGSFFELEGANENRWAFVKSSTTRKPDLTMMQRPISVFEWFEHCVKQAEPERYPSLAVITQLGSERSLTPAEEDALVHLTPRISTLANVMVATGAFTADPVDAIPIMVRHGFPKSVASTMPEAMIAPLEEAIARCERAPPTTWPSDLLRVVGRGDLVPELEQRTTSSVQQNLLTYPIHDVHEICQMRPSLMEARSREASRHAVSRLIFHTDRRYLDAVMFMHFNQPQVAECPRQREWDENTHWEVQRRLVHWVTIRMIALPAGEAMIHYDSQDPLLTERFHLPGFNSSCVMLPMGHTLTTDRTGLTEERLNWAYFHAGVSSGLSISHSARGIDTSWIAFNKPTELTNRHAGLLLALGLGGHLRNVAKWLSFKYLTPKHTMTSIGLLLGLSASNLGTMDSLVTRMLSVHITRMLPPGAAELNVSAATQTAGLMGIGLLYYNSQHRRMSEIMLSEIELMDIEDPDNGPELLRDESYRLAGGFALGLINLGKGHNLRGLHGMRLPERLLAMAVGPRPVNAVHVFDRATAGAVIALALVYMKSGDKAIANKIDIPDTEAQFDQVRPDILMLRAMAKHLILWDDIQARAVGLESQGWIMDNLPICYQNRSKQVMESIIANRAVKSAHIPLFNVFTGLAWALSLKYAGSGNTVARDDILKIYNFFHSLSISSDAFYFDSRLGRASLRRCMDALALFAATVMAGTGDLVTFRYLRRLHGRTDPETQYGSHLAAHLAIGTLFLGGGTYTFGTSDLAIATLACAFYPLFPTDAHDNRVHLQAFRHLWVFAAEARCIVVEDFETQRPIAMPIKVLLKDGTRLNLTAPYLLPDLDTIASIQTDDPSYWRVTLDFASNPEHLASFRKDQRVFVRRCPAAEAHSSTFGAALAALNEAQSTRSVAQIWHSIFQLPVFKDLDKADVELVLPPEVHSSVYTEDRGTVVDDRLVLGKAAKSSDRDSLWDLRMLFAWAERARDQGDGKLRWLGREVVEELKARIDERMGVGRDI